jgi:hypothetical protein
MARRSGQSKMASSTNHDQRSAMSNAIRLLAECLLAEGVDDLSARDGLRALHDCEVDLMAERAITALHNTLQHLRIGDLAEGIRRVESWPGDTSRG